jgi:hypothetical protein
MADADTTPAKKKAKITPPVAVPPAPVMPEKPKVKNVKFEVIQPPHENIKNNTIDSVVKCSCGALSEICIPIESATRTLTLGAANSFVVSYHVKPERVVCKGCGGRYQSD